MPRRERWTIFANILQALEDERGRGGSGRITAVAARANIPHDRLGGFLRELETKGLVAPDLPNLPVVTPKGAEYLRHYTHWMENLSRFGLQ